MRRWLWVWAANVVALAVVAHLGIGIRASGWLPLIEAALVLGVVNAVIRPIARLLTLPLTVLSLGLFSLVLSGLLLWLVAAIVPGFYVAGFLAAVVGAVALAIITGVLHWVIKAA
jgi:putative membrane protein